MSITVERPPNENLALLDIPGCEFTPVSLTLPPNLSFDQWVRIGRQLQYANLAVQWWIGDWLVYGEHRWREKYAQAVEQFGRAEQTLMNYHSVAKAISSSRRREQVSYSVHAELVGIPEEEQDRILDEAERDPEYTVKQARRESRRVQRRLGKEKSEIELVHTPEVQEFLNGYIETLKKLEESVPLTARFLRNMFQAHSAQAHWQLNRTIADDCEAIMLPIRKYGAVAEDDLYTWLIEHGYFMSDPEFEERLEYMQSDKAKMISKTDAGKAGKQDERRGKLPQMYVKWFKDWSGLRRQNEDEEDD